MIVLDNDETVYEEISSSENSPKSLTTNNINKSASQSDMNNFNKTETSKLDVYDSKSLNENTDLKALNSSIHCRELESPKITLNDTDSADTSCDSANDKNFDIYS